MRRATAFLGIVTLSPAFAGEPLSVREYEERCASYYARQYGVSPALGEFSATLRSGSGAGRRTGYFGFLPAGLTLRNSLSHL
jgi:hypothetical protein